MSYRFYPLAHDVSKGVLVGSDKRAAVEFLTPAQARLRRHYQEERKILAQVEEEARQPERYPER